MFSPIQLQVDNAKYWKFDYFQNRFIQKFKRIAFIVWTFMWWNVFEQPQKTSHSLPTELTCEHYGKCFEKGHQNNGFKLHYVVANHSYHLHPLLLLPFPLIQYFWTSIFWVEKRSSVPTWAPVLAPAPVEKRYM